MFLYTDDWNCSAGWEVGDDKCYKFSDSDKTWDEANADCISQGATILNIVTEYIMSYISGNVCFQNLLIFLIFISLSSDRVGFKSRCNY